MMQELASVQTVQLGPVGEFDAKQLPEDVWKHHIATFLMADDLRALRMVCRFSARCVPRLHSPDSCVGFSKEATQAYAMAERLRARYKTVVIDAYKKLARGHCHVPAAFRWYLDGRLLSLDVLVSTVALPGWVRAASSCPACRQLYTLEDQTCGCPEQCDTLRCRDLPPGDRTSWLGWV